MRPIILFILLFIIVYYANAQISETTINALSSNDIQTLYSQYNNNKQERAFIEDALCTIIDWEKITYEELLCFNNIKSECCFCVIAQQHLKAHESIILNKALNMTAEELTEYIKTNPSHLSVINSCLKTILFNNLDSVNYEELDYIARELKITDSDAIVKNLDKRISEKQLLAKNKLEEYCYLEQKQAHKLMLLLKVGAWQYLYNRFMEVADSYSKIGIVPDEPYRIAEQFDNIVSCYFQPEDFHKQIEDEVAKYNIAINKARAEYAKLSNISQVPLSDIKTPPIDKFNYENNYETINMIPAARREFINFQETKSQIANAASWFVGDFWAAIGKGIVDVMTMDDWAINEIFARKKHMKEVYEQLTMNIFDYCNNLYQNINQQIYEDQLKFKNHVNKQK